ncbi:MAG: spore germination protein [Clostridia bacterium]|nr:spore germination protein [Clostridia bacterium]
MIKKVSDRLNSELRANNLKGILNDNTDVVIRNIFLADIKSCLVFIDGLSDLEQINLNIINPLKKITKFDFKNLKQIADLNANFCNFEVVEDLKTMQLNILKGQAVLFVDGFKGAICFNVIKYESRGIVEPPSSTVINGPREGFNESIKTNISLIRKRLASTSLKIEDMQVGLRTNTAIKIVYFDDLADKSVVEQVKNKISKIKIDGIIDSYYISKFLEKYPNSMFRQIGSCEKPDIVCAKLLEGRVAIFVDGSPIVLTVPFVFIEDFQSANDYYSDAYRASFLRILRLFAFCVSIYLPGMYMALQLFHYKVLPLKFLVTIINTTQSLPLNPFLEIFFIIILFDILFEASLRMPKYLGIAVSIVGALILGDTAVKAGLVSPPGVMIVAMSAITIYIIPNQSSQISMLRLVFAFIGGSLGFHGIVLGTMFLFSYLAKIDSFGAPFLAPYAPYIFEDQNDAFIKLNLKHMKNTPKSFPNKSKKRLKTK